MSALVLKLIACVTMLIDHVGVLGLAKHYIVLRMIGRIAFPIFAWNIGNGYIYTKNKCRYLCTLIAFGFISEVPFSLFARGQAFLLGHCNVMFTLALGLFAIMFIDQALSVFRLESSQLGRFAVAVIIAVLVSLIADIMGSDYGAKGVLLIVAFWLAGGSKLWTAVVILIFTAFNMITYPEFLHIYFFCVLSIIPLLLYNGKSGYENMSLKMKTVIKYCFYIFYPVHLIVLLLI